MRVTRRTHLGDGSRRGAALYVVVLGVSLIVAVLGLAALSELHLQRETSERSHDMQCAQRYAQAAVEIGMQRIADDADWRNTYSNGAWESQQAIGGGTFSIEGIDPDDGVLNDSDADSIVLTGTGVHGSATQKVEVMLVPDPQALTCLEVALLVGSTLTVDAAATVTGSVTVASNNSIDGNNNGSFAPDSEAVTGYAQPLGPGSTTTGVAARDLPTWNDAIDYYQTNGTPISIASIPQVDSIRTIEQVVLSASNNPYGANVTNAEGIYVIDCQSQDIRIRDCRLVATLLLLNAGSNSEISGSVNWSAAVSNYPVLLTETMAFNFSNADLVESSTNFNPTSTPYGGNSDTDTSDTYPSIIDGLIHISDDATTNNHPVFDGVVIVGNALQVFGDLDLSFRSTYLDDPPPGFVDNNNLLVNGNSWRQRVD